MPKKRHSVAKRLRLFPSRKGEDGAIRILSRDQRPPHAGRNLLTRGFAVQVKEHRCSFKAIGRNRFDLDRASVTYWILPAWNLQQR